MTELLDNLWKSKRWQREVMVEMILCGIGSGQDEYYVRRRLLQRFEEGVGALARYHMHFIDYIDFVTEDVGSVVHPLLQVIHIVDAAVAGFVYLDDVQRAAPVDGNARFAGVAGLTFDRAPAVDSFGQYAGGAGLAAAPRAAEQVSVGNPSAFDCVKESLGYVFLAGYFAECLGTPFTIKNLGSHGALIIP